MIIKYTLFRDCEYDNKIFKVNMTGKLSLRLIFRVIFHDCVNYEV